MNIYLSNSFLILILFLNPYCLKSSKLKKNLTFLAFIVCKPDLPFIKQDYTLNKNLLDSNKITDLTKIKPFSQKTSNKIIKTFYPNKMLKVKEDLSRSDQFYNKIVFDEKKFILLFLYLTLLFLFTTYEITKNRPILKQKLKSDSFSKIKQKSKSDSFLKIKQKLKSNFRLKQPFGNFTRVKILEKVLQKLKEIFVFNNFISLDKINKNWEENTVSFCCKHYFLDVKKQQKVILTKDFPALLLYAGMTGIVNKVLLNQKLEIIFFYNSQSCDRLTKQKLYNFQTSFIREADLFSKK